MAKFEASDYSRFRVSYPKVLFDKIRSHCGNFIGHAPVRVLDLGSGTGFSTQAFLEFFPHAEVTLVEPDPEMLRHAREYLESESRFSGTRFRYVNQSAEAFEFSEPYDLVLIGSAWHWMDRALLVQKFEASGVGCVFVFEYQFPKAKMHIDLNEWVRREFNLRWRTQQQVPRGTLAELTQGLRDSHLFSEASRTYLPNETDFDLDAFFGMLISQSRFLAYEAQLPMNERDAYRQSVREELAKFWGLQKHLPFFLPYEGYVFGRRRI